MQCKIERFSKPIQIFYDLNEYCNSLKNELKYAEDIEDEFLQNEIDYNCFDQEEFDNVESCKYCECEFGHDYNDRCIILNEICDKDKLLHILENNDFNEEINNLVWNYYNSLDKDGCKKIIYKQNDDKNRYYAEGSCLTYLKK